MSYDSVVEPVPNGPYPDNAFYALKCLFHQIFVAEIDFEYLLFG